MKYVDRNVTVPPNARIITSGLTQRVPKGLLVGVAVGARKNEQDDAQDIEVVPLANFDALESVTIILNPEQR
jgi:cell shape-determining protein MreC